MRSIGAMLGEPPNNYSERVRRGPSPAKKARAASKLAVIRQSTKDHLSYQQKVLGTNSDPQIHKHNALLDRLKRQRTNRYFGRGELAYEREDWMDKNRSAHIQILEKAEASALCLVRYGYDPDKSQRVKKEKNKFRTHGNSQANTFTYANQGGICHYCKRYIFIEDWTVDHLTPLARGGDNLDNNKKGCCERCNNAKSCLTEEEYRATEFFKNPSTKSEQRLKQQVRDIIKLVRPEAFQSVMRK